MANSSYLQVEGLTKSFGQKVLFHDVSFGISEGERIAIVARNGAGKTTLMNIIAGSEPYDSGAISFKRDLVMGILPQDPHFPAGMSVLQACLHSNSDQVKAIARYEKALLQPENTEELNEAMADMDSLKAWDYETRIKQILGKLNIHDLEQKVDNLSGGQLKRVALANVLIMEPELLILDEPTNHLDLAMVEWLEDYISNSRMALLMVTHDRYFLDRVCSHILEIDNQQLYSYHGNYTYYLEKRQERLEQQNAELARANNLYRKELDWMRRQPQARGTKAQYRIDAFNELEEKVKQKKQAGNVQLDVKASYIGSKIFEAKYISKAFVISIQSQTFFYHLNDFIAAFLNFLGKSSSFFLIVKNMDKEFFMNLPLILPIPMNGLRMSFPILNGVSI